MIGVLFVNSWTLQRLAVPDVFSNKASSTYYCSLFPRQQWKDEKNNLQMQVNDLEKRLKGNEEKFNKREKENKKVSGAWFTMLSTSNLIF